LLRFEATKVILRHAGERTIVSNLGPTTDELWHAGHRDRNFYTYGSMGLCSSIALGMAMSTSEQVISLDGDGSLLMNLGAIATIGREQPKNLIVVVWDNEEWGQTGHQPSHTAKGTDLVQVARACGIPHAATVRDLEALEEVFCAALRQEGPWFIVAKIQEAEYLSVGPIEPEMTLYRFRNSFPRPVTSPPVGGS
jgi:sulfopyruvate decarboxylase subunit beta